MSVPEIEIDHIGVAVPSLDANNAFWQAMGWPANGQAETVPDQKVKVAMLALKNNATVELLEPTDSSSPVAKFMDKRGPGVHHICFRVKDIDSTLERLKKAGVKLINETPVKGARGARVAFVHPSSTGGILIELSEGSGHP